MKSPDVTCVDTVRAIALVVVLGMLTTAQADHGDISRPIEVRYPSQLPGQLAAE